MTEPLEIERKFLIEMPDRTLLDRCPVRWEMWQTYLLSRPGVSARVRRRVGETEQFFHTEKQRLTDRTCVEREREIDAREYEALLAQRDPARVTIHKVRYCLPEGGLVFEIDVYPFWRRLAVMEVELQREDQRFTVPPGASGAAGGIRRPAAEKRRPGGPCAAGGRIVGRSRRKWNNSLAWKSGMW